MSYRCMPQRPHLDLASATLLRLPSSCPPFCPCMQEALQSIKKLATQTDPDSQAELLTLLRSLPGAVRKPDVHKAVLQAGSTAILDSLLLPPRGQSWEVPEAAAAAMNAIIDPQDNLSGVNASYANRIAPPVK
jgi:hypothetical protein